MEDISKMYSVTSGGSDGVILKKWTIVSKMGGQCMCCVHYLFVVKGATLPAKMQKMAVKVALMIMVAMMR